MADVLRSVRGDPGGAESHYGRAVMLAEAQNPPEWDQIDSAYLGLGLIYGERGDFNKALDALDRAQTADPNDSGPLSARGGVLLQVGRWKEAQDLLRKALKLNPDDVNALNGLGLVAWQNEHEYEEAVAYFEQALATYVPSDSFNASLHNSLGGVYCEMGRSLEAIGHFQHAVELASNDPGYHTNLAHAFKLQGRPDEARTELRKALALAPDYVPARVGISELENDGHLTQ
ncbi:MAG TPA: tetratricopeptide repeat protein [Terriglobia bacterium]|nr:tetratricopeptide repeat protein [Terriglobia bacterium]